MNKQCKKYFWINLIKSYGSNGMPVNRKCHPQLKNHYVLRKLIKLGKVKKLRHSFSFTNKCTMLIVVE